MNDIYTKATVKCCICPIEAEIKVPIQGTVFKAYKEDLDWQLTCQGWMYSKTHSAYICPLCLDTSLDTNPKGKK